MLDPVVASPAPARRRVRERGVSILTIALFRRARPGDDCGSRAHRCDPAGPSGATFLLRAPSFLSSRPGRKARPHLVFSRHIVMLRRAPRERLRMGSSSVDPPPGPYPWGRRSGPFKSERRFLTFGQSAFRTSRHSCAAGSSEPADTAGAAFTEGENPKSTFTPGFVQGEGAGSR
jgi:hypothetical protein